MYLDEDFLTRQMMLLVLLKIELTDNEFNKVFTTKTTDDIEARYILSTNFARKILDYSNRMNGKVEFAFVDSENVYL